MLDLFEIYIYRNIVLLKISAFVNLTVLVSLVVCFYFLILWEWYASP